MSRLMTLVAALTAIFVLSLAGPVDAAERKADGIKNAAAGWDISAHRRSYRHTHRRYYRPYYPYYYGGYPYYGYGYPYGYYRPYYYGAPGFGFSFRF